MTLKKRVAKPKAKRARKGAGKVGAARKRAAPDVSLTAALAEAAWAEADQALAQALADLDEAQTATESGVREDAMAQLAQSLARAARKRGLARIGAVGAREPYDAKRHDLVSPVAKAPKTVRIEARGVARGAEILAKPRVGPVGRKKRS